MTWSWTWTHIQTHTNTTTHQIHSYWKLKIFYFIPPLLTEMEVNPKCMAFLQKVTSSSLWSFMAYHHALYCSYHLLSIISPLPFHHFLLLSLCTVHRHQTDVWLMFSYKIEESRITLRDVGFEPYRSVTVWGILQICTKCSSLSLMLKNWTANKAVVWCHTCKIACS